MPVSVGPSIITINHDDRFLISNPDASFTPTEDAGFFARDTRMVSGYRMTINGFSPILLNAATVEHFSARHEFTTPELPISGAYWDPGSRAFPLARSGSDSTARCTRAC